MRAILTWVAVIAFSLLGAVSLWEGNLRVGVATCCLGLANGLLLL